MTDQDWKEITSSNEVIELIKDIDKIEEKIRAIDKNALINYELYKLSL